MPVSDGAVIDQHVGCVREGMRGGGTQGGEMGVTNQVQLDLQGQGSFDLDGALAWQRPTRRSQCPGT